MEVTSTDIYQSIHEVVVDGLKTNDALIPHLLDILSNCSASNKESFLNIIVDVLVQIDLETQCANNQPDSTVQRDAFVSLTKDLLASKVVTDSLLKERFDVETSHLVGIVPDKKQFQTMYNRLRTRLYYKQNKYNLMKEENEGFARVIVVLSQSDLNDVPKLVQKVTELIGKFNLDPNRVLDLVLEALENNAFTNPEPYIELLKSFYNHGDKTRQILALKMSFYANSKIELTVISQSMYRMIAILIHKEIIQLDDLYPYLLPQDDKILDLHKSLLEEARIESRRYATVIIGEEKKQESALEKLSEEDRHFLSVDNQKTNICAHLLQIGDWEQALFLAKKLPEFYCFSSRNVAGWACDIVEYLIDPLYMRYCGLPPLIKQKLKPQAKKNISLEQVTDIPKLETELFPLVFALGPYLSANTLVLTKLIRTLKGILCENQRDLIVKEEPLYYSILEVINESILPALTLSGGNCCLSREMWSLMKNLNYHTRYKLYSNWKDEGMNQHLLRAKGSVLLEAKHHMKRLSKDTIRATGRHLGKLCYLTPINTLNYVLTTIQSYDNLIVPLIDALKYLPSLALDVLVWCIIEALADPTRNRHSSDGMAIAPWLQGLSTFSSNFILKYKVEFNGFLQFIANQLKAGKSLDLVLMADLIQRMTGIESTQDITDDKIEALLGGEVLRTEAAYFNQGKNTRKSAARLKDALIESRLAMPLCILMAQLRDCLFFTDQEESHLKLVGKLYDQCQETFVQYGVFLSFNLSIDDYINFLPSLHSLMTEHKLTPDAAFFLARPMIMHKIKSKFNELKSNAAKKSGDDNEMIEDDESLFIQSANSVFDPIVADLETTIKANYGQFSVKLFVLFWTLTMSNLQVPTSRYEREIQRLKALLNENDDDPRKRKEFERLAGLIQKLKYEQEEQIEHCKFINAYLDHEKKNIILEKVASNSELTHQFIQHCLFSRSILTVYDAIYSARFILTLHDLKLDGFPTLICYDRLLCDITCMMGACTENEVKNYGKFLANILKTISAWHKDPVLYDERCGTYPGFVFRITDDKDPKTNLEYENFRHVCHKWHYRLTKALVLSLESNSYVQIRNALIVLISIIDYFPVITNFARAIERRIEEVRSEEKDKRHDLYALATAYFGRLEAKKRSFIQEGMFHKVDESKNEVNNSTNSSSNNHSNSNSQSDSNSTNAVNNSNSNSTKKDQLSTVATIKSSNSNSTNNIRTSSSSSMNNHSHVRSSSSSRPSSKSRGSPRSESRERHSSSSRKRLKKT